MAEVRKFRQVLIRRRLLFSWQELPCSRVKLMMGRTIPVKNCVDNRDVLRWVDRMLIRLCARYADYRVFPFSSTSLTLCRKMTLRASVWQTTLASTLNSCSTSGVPPSSRSSINPPMKQPSCALSSTSKTSQTPSS